jgi:hypothetical protein
MMMSFKEREMNRTSEMNDGLEFADARLKRTLPESSRRLRAELEAKRARRSGKTISLKAARAALDALLAR